MSDDWGASASGQSQSKQTKAAESKVKLQQQPERKTKPEVDNSWSESVSDGWSTEDWGSADTGIFSEVWIMGILKTHIANFGYSKHVVNKFLWSGGIADKRVRLYCSKNLIPNLVL